MRDAGVDHLMFMQHSRLLGMLQHAVSCTCISVYVLLPCVCLHARIWIAGGRACESGSRTLLSHISMLALLPPQNTPFHSLGCPTYSWQHAFSI